MSILSLLLGLAINHFAPAVSAFRRYQWLLFPSRQAYSIQAVPGWMPMLILLLFALVAGSLLAWLGYALAGAFGLLLVNVLIVVYCLGPRDLDRDVGQALESDTARWQLKLSPDANGIEAAGSVLQAALARWFGIVFWFALLGIPGALIYRGARVAYRCSRASEDQKAWFGQLLFVLNLPVLLLMTLAMALMTDFDQVRTNWSAQARPWLIDAAWLDRLANVVCTPDCDTQQGLNEGRDLAWRMMWVWLAILSLMLLAGWIR